MVVIMIRFNMRCSLLYADEDDRIAVLLDTIDIGQFILWNKNHISYLNNTWYFFYRRRGPGAGEVFWGGGAARSAVSGSCPRVRLAQGKVLLVTLSSLPPPRDAESVFSKKTDEFRLLIQAVRLMRIRIMEKLYWSGSIQIRGLQKIAHSKFGKS